MSRLAFLHLTTFYPNHHFGGDAVYVKRLAEGLAARGHHVEVAHSVDAYRMLRGPVRRPLAPSRVAAVHGLSGAVPGAASLLAHQLGYPWLHRGALLRILRSRRFDVVHYHNISLFGPGILRLGSHPRTVKLYTAHDHWLVCPTHVLWKFNRRLCERPQCLACVLQAKKPPQAWRSFPWLARCAREVDRFLAPSEATADTHARRGFGQSMQVLPLFAPLLTRRPDDHACHSRPYFLFVGRLEEIKGVHTVIPLFEGLGADLLIAGDGAAEPALRRLAGSNVHFLGWLEPDHLTRYYAGAIACLLPSLTHETFGTVILEAFACQTPVLVSKIASTSGLVEKSGGGRIYRSPSELRELMLALLENPEQAREWGRLGHRAFLQRWTPQVHLDRYLELVEKLLHEKRRA